VALVGSTTYVRHIKTIPTTMAIAHQPAMSNFPPKPTVAMLVTPQQSSSPVFHIPSEYLHDVTGHGKQHETEPEPRSTVLHHRPRISVQQRHEVSRQCSCKPGSGYSQPPVSGKRVSSRSGEGHAEAALSISADSSPLVHKADPLAPGRQN
jgi:hypothetical protein